MATVVRRLIAVQADVAGLRAYRRVAHDDIFDAILDQVAVEQPDVEGIGLEGYDDFHAGMPGSMHGVPAEIGTDIDENALRCVSEIVLEPAGGNWFVRAVFRDMPADQVTVVHEKLQLRAARAHLEGRTPRHQPRGEKYGRAADARDTDHWTATLTASHENLAAALDSLNRLVHCVLSQLWIKGAGLLPAQHIRDLTSLPTPSVWAHSSPSSMISSSLKCLERSR